MLGWLVEIHVICGSQELFIVVKVSLQRYHACYSWTQLSWQLFSGSALLTFISSLYLEVWTNPVPTKSLHQTGQVLVILETYLWSLCSVGLYSCSSFPDKECSAAWYSVMYLDPWQAAGATCALAPAQRWSTVSGPARVAKNRCIALALLARALLIHLGV